MHTLRWTPRVGQLSSSVYQDGRQCQIACKDHVHVKEFHQIDWDNKVHLASFQQVEIDGSP